MVAEAVLDAAERSRRGVVLGADVRVCRTRGTLIALRPLTGRRRNVGGVTTRDGELPWAAAVREALMGQRLPTSGPGVGANGSFPRGLRVARRLPVARCLPHLGIMRTLLRREGKAPPRA